MPHTPPSHSIATVQNALSNLQASQQLINRSYLAQLEQNAVMAYPRETTRFTPSSDVRIFRIERIVQGNKQAVLESLTAAYTAIGAAGYTVFLYLRSNGQETEVCIGTRGEPGRAEGHNSGALLHEAFKGHFAGSSLKSLDGSQVRDLLAALEDAKTQPSTSVTAVTGVPALSTDNREHFMQGLERFIDAAERRVYQALILAEPIAPSTLDVIRQGYEQVATQLSPLLKTQLSYGEQDSESIGATLTASLSESLGTSLALTETKGTSRTEGTSTSHTTGTSESVSAQSSASKTASIAGMALGTLGGAFGGPVGALAGAAVGSALGTVFGQQQTTGTSESFSKSSNVSDSTSHSTSKAKTQSTTTTQGTSDSRSRTSTTGQTRQQTLEIIDKGVEQLLEKISHHLTRINEAKTYGGWNSAAYFIGDNRASSETLASIFLGLIRGENSATEDFALSTWANATKDKKSVLEWLAHLEHPQIKSNFSRTVPIEYLTPATLITGKEMAIQLSLPRRSTSTVAVVETQAFGRKVQWINQQNAGDESRRLELGNLRHLWENLPQNISLNLDHLTGHMFISGSTGSGKSNTLYEILDQVDRAGIPFMVIEPAKGEYKHVFGHRKNVQVYGTNPTQAELLRINPFSFPPGIHVLEHIDRLIEIFNVCWPMYAAMPAVLKEAILLAYEDAGWDLSSSCNPVHATLFPGFNDLLFSLEQVIESSSYSQEAKSNYIGALSTRVKSLINGLNGQIFSANELDNSTLFDQSTLIDLSRVGSNETKSLIIGMLIMRLSEYRMSCGHMNQPLQHITVLEEAHNILRRSNGTSGPEGAGMAEKSIEMLTNAIAEMRTYGEGFIIVDQSPNAVDIAAIRNTNTKIIMRLPDETDRRLIGKSVALSDDQLEEIAKFPKGVAVIYQNDWLEPVLCQINKFQGSIETYSPHQHPIINDISVTRNFRLQALRLLLSERVNQPLAPVLDILISTLSRQNMLAASKRSLLHAVEQANSGKEIALTKSEAFTFLAPLVTNILECRYAVRHAIHSSEGFDHLHEKLAILIKELVPEIDSELSLAAEQCLMKDFSIQNEKNIQIYQAWVKYIELQGKI